jgi:hypothetical protein
VHPGGHGSSADAGASDTDGARAARTVAGRASSHMNSSRGRGTPTELADPARVREVFDAPAKSVAAGPHRIRSARFEDLNHERRRKVGVLNGVRHPHRCWQVRREWSRLAGDRARMYQASIRSAWQFPLALSTPAAKSVCRQRPRSSRAACPTRQPRGRVPHQLEMSARRQPRRRSWRTR